jgi:hypothetical protein
LFALALALSILGKMESRPVKHKASQHDLIGGILAGTMPYRHPAGFLSPRKYYFLLTGQLQATAEKETANTRYTSYT